MTTGPNTVSRDSAHLVQAQRGDGVQRRVLLLLRAQQPRLPVAAAQRLRLAESPPQDAF